jgi:hypothetical protein
VGEVLAIPTVVGYESLGVVGFRGGSTVR